MRLALDTNRYTDFCRGDERAVEVLETAEAIYVPFVVFGELRAGFAVGKQGARNERVRVLYADDQTTQQYALVYRQLRSQGTPIPTNDMWVAALVLQHNLALFARDRHFDHLPQIVRAD